MAPMLLPVSLVPATATNATARGDSAVPSQLPVGDHELQGLRGALAALCHTTPCGAMPCCATPRHAAPRHAMPHQLLAMPAPTAVPGSGCCPAGAASACPSPVLPGLISRDPAQGAHTTSGPGPCKQLSRVSCQLFAYKGRTVLRSSPEGPVRGHRVTTSRCRELPQGYGAEPVPAPSPRHPNASLCQGSTVPGLLPRAVGTRGCSPVPLVAPAGCAWLRDQRCTHPPRPPVPSGAWAGPGPAAQGGTGAAAAEPAKRAQSRRQGSAPRAAHSAGL